MPRFSPFTPMGQLRMSAAPSHVENFYHLLPVLWGTELDFTQIGSYNEAKLYAVARLLALAFVMVEKAGNQAAPSKVYDLLPLLELDYLLTPGPKDDLGTRQRVLAAAKLLTGGAAASNVVNLLKTLLGKGNFLAYLPSDPSPQVFPAPANVGNGPGAFKDVRVPAKLLKLVDPVATTGSVWCAYQALDTTTLPTLIWSASATFAQGQAVLPVTANGFYFVCTVAGTTGTTEPAWPSQLGATIVDGSVTWQCLAPIAPALVKGDVVVVDAGNTSQMEKVTVTAVASTPPAGSQTSSGTYLYFQATFANSHDVGAVMTTGNYPYWFSTQRHGLVVLPGTLATDQATRQKVNNLLAKILRVVDQWAIVQPATTTTTGGTVGPLTVNTPFGVATLASETFANSN